MLVMFELCLSAALIFVFFSILFLPFGHVCVGRQLKILPANYRLLCSFGVSILFYSGLLSGLLLTGVSAEVSANVLRFVAVVSFVFWIIKGGPREINLDFLLGLIAMCIYFFLVLYAAAFPLGELRDIRSDTIQALTGLPIDNLIPYNIARYIVEDISTLAIDVVPEWKAGDRGPIAGLITAVVFLLLGLKESAPWLSSSGGLFYVYQATLLYLNLLSLLAVWVISCEMFGRRSACIAALLIGSTYFYFVNLLFTWPKLLMAYFMLLALVLWERKQLSILAGYFFAGSMLSHDSAVFCLCALGFLLILGRLTRGCPEIGAVGVGSETLNYAGKVFMAFLLCYIPWSAFKWISQSSSSHLATLSLFCLKDAQASTLGFKDSLRLYLERYTLMEIIGVRIENLLHPFNLFHPAEMFVKFWKSPYVLISSIKHLAFYQFIFALGLPTFLLSLRAYFYAGQDESLSKLRIFFLVTLGALIPAAFSLGCELATVNHVWAYPAFLVFAISAGVAVIRGGIINSVICGLGLGLNLLFLVFNFFFQMQAFVFDHSSGLYFFSVMLMFILWVVFLLIVFAASKGVVTNELYSK